MNAEDFRVIVILGIIWIVVNIKTLKYEVEKMRRG